MFSTTQDQAAPSCISGRLRRDTACPSRILSPGLVNRTHSPQTPLRDSLQGDNYRHAHLICQGQAWSRDQGEASCGHICPQSIDVFNTKVHLGQVDPMSQITRFFVHHVSEGNGIYFRFGESPARIQRSTRAMFVREPLSRLWAVYLDKFVLPDSWMDHGLRILHRRRWRSVHSQDRESHQSCPTDVTFSEFLQYALVKQDSHWSPIHKTCDPCLFKPHIVGKVETFDR
ncbi:carbohydrate sulfotransferase [Elysia marginata]|uniref:Carbohydrate sulfotransferase n=1 Tax=Elysia marginata TaxID=1093978 RepID=A0AAV4IER2_9GAST|nr:carbohydrate sulfotransferase [Elysia marginata]